MQAIIMAGGKGTRLKPLTDIVPKLLLPLNNKPLLDYLIEHLKKHGFENVIICTGNLADKIEAYVQKKKYGITLNLSREKKPLGTAGALHLVEDLLKDEFLVLYGDIFTNINLQRMLKFHIKKGADATIALHKSDHPQDSTVVKVGENERIINFVEKPGDNWKIYGNLTATSIYILKKDILNLISNDGEEDLAKDLFPKLLKKNKNLFGYFTNEYAKDIGTPERYQKVQEYVKINYQT